MADLSEPTGFAFLQTIGPRERRLPGVVVTIVLAALAGFAAAIVVGALVTLVAAGIVASGAGFGLPAAMDILSDGGRAGRSLDSYAYELALVGGASLAAAVAFIAVAAGRAERPVRTYLTAAPRFRWRQSVAGLVIFLPVVAAEIWLEGLVRPPDGGAPLTMAGVSLGARLTYAAAALGFLWCAALAEEILFRGWLLQQTRAFTRSIAVVVAVNAAAFSLAHGDPSLGGLVTRFALGVGWAWIVLRLNGVEFAAGAHLANNLGIALLAQPVLLTQPAPQPFEPLSVALQIGATAALVIGVEWWVRRKAADGPDSSGNLGEHTANT